MHRKHMILLLVVLLLVGLTPQALGADIEAAKPGLTIEQAVDRALVTSHVLKQSELDIEQAEEGRATIADVVKFIPLESSGSTQADQAYTNLVAADIAWTMSKKSRDINADKITLATFNAYVGVIKAEQNLNYYRDALSKAQLDWHAANQRFRLGMMSSIEKAIADSQYLNSQKALDSAQDQLTTAYQIFNKQLGLGIDERPVLNQKPAYSPLVLDNLDAAVNRAVDNNPLIWLSAQQIDLAKLQLTLFNWTEGNSHIYRSSEINVEKADLESVQAKSDLRQAVRNIYYNIRSLENAYTLQVEGVKLAQSNYDLAKLRFDIGMATEVDVAEAKALLEKAILDLDATVYQHEYLKMVFARPWAAVN